VENKRAKQTIHIEVDFTPERVTYFCGICKRVLLTKNDWRKSNECPIPREMLADFIATHPCFEFQPVS